MQEHYDVIIIGAGLSGSVAAVEAVQKGLSVLVLEKYDSVGGSGNYVEGIFAVNSYLQKQQQISLSAQTVLDEELAYSHYLADPTILKDYIQSSADNVSWLKSLGVTYLKVLEQANGFQTWHLFDGLGKQVIQTVLLPLAQQSGADVVTGVTVDHLQLTKGVVTGVHLQESHQQPRTIAASAVIIASGGYLNNQWMVDQHTPYKMPVLPINSGHNTGDGLQLAYDAGAQKAKLGTIMLCGGTVKDLTKPAYKYRDDPVCIAAAKQGMLWVNERGERFVDESIASNLSLAGNALVSQNRVFSILNQATLARLETGALPRPMNFGAGPVTSLPGLTDEVAKMDADKLPFIQSADSITDLAELVGLPHLTETVTHYNQLCQNHEDSDLGKSTNYLYDLKEGPFYAIELAAGAFCTVGGLKVDRQNTVLDEQGQPIAGLYAVGNDAAGSLVGDTYGFNFPGTEAGYAVYSGRNSVDHVATLTNEMSSMKN